MKTSLLLCALGTVGAAAVGGVGVGLAQDGKAKAPIAAGLRFPSSGEWFVFWGGDACPSLGDTEASRKAREGLEGALQEGFPMSWTKGMFAVEYVQSCYQFF